MPSNIVKSFVKKSGKSVNDVEKLWNKAKAIIEKEYPGISAKDDPKFFALVTGTLKNMLNIKEMTFKDFVYILKEHN